jgi:rhodanese-related sulfurtransferase
VAALRGRPLVVHCGHSERASSAASIMERRGFDDVRIVEGGAAALMSATAA